MLEEILMRMMDLQGYSLLRAELRAGEFHVWVERKEEWFECPWCREVCGVHDRREVVLKERPVLGKPTFVHIPHYRIRCRRCEGRLMAVDISIQEEGFRVTHWLADAVVEAARWAPVKFVAALYHLSWNTVRDIDLKYLRRAIEAVDPVAPNSIGLDEMSYAGGRRYLTVVTDQSRRRVVFVTKGRRAENLREFFERRIDPMACKHLEAASMDMWNPYVKMVRQYAPQALIVYDPFHVIAILNRAVERVRWQEQKRLEQAGMKVLKRNRYLFLKGQERLRPDEQQTLGQLLDQNQRLHEAYLLKEQFRSLYSLPREANQSDAAYYRRGFQFLVGWVRRATASGLRPFLKFVHEVQQRWAGILNYLRYPITNGLSEALNNKIASLKKRAYGLRNFEYFILKIYQQGGLILSASP